MSKVQEAPELIKNRELNLYVSRNRLSHRTKIIICNIARLLALYNVLLSRYEQNLYLRTPVRK